MVKALFNHEVRLDTTISKWSFTLSVYVVKAEEEDELNFFEGDLVEGWNYFYIFLNNTLLV